MANFNYGVPTAPPPMVGTPTAPPSDLDALRPMAEPGAGSGSPLGGLEDVFRMLLALSRQFMAMGAQGMVHAISRAIALITDEAQRLEAQMTAQAMMPQGQGPGMPPVGGVPPGPGMPSPGGMPMPGGMRTPGQGAMPPGL
jgi:hypothetical protein